MEAGQMGFIWDSLGARRLVRDIFTPKQQVVPPVSTVDAHTMSKVKV